MSKLTNLLWVISLLVSELALLNACSEPAVIARRLPHLGEADVAASGDTLWPVVPTFHLHDQENAVIRPATFAGRTYVTNFFFATCPTICPGMQRQLLRVYSRYKGDNRVAFLSHTIDPAHDSVPVLRDYAHRLGVPDAKQWHFATAPRDTIFALARQYLVSAQVDPSAPGGAVHSGAFVLVDPQRHIRGMYDGTNPAEVNRLLQDLPLLLAEFAPAQKAER
jgi:protein SCO1/2